MEHSAKSRAALSENPQNELISRLLCIQVDCCVRVCYSVPCPLLMLCYGHAMVCIEVPVVLIIAELAVWCSKLMLWLLVEESNTVPSRF